MLSGIHQIQTKVQFKLTQRGKCDNRLAIMSIKEMTFWFIRESHRQQSVPLLILDCVLIDTAFHNLS